MSVKLHAHQVQGVAKMHNGCVLYGDVGVGKTITSLAYYFDRVCNGTINEWGSMKTPKDVYVITTAKVRDGKGFELQASAFGVFADREISTNGVAITVDSWNNLHKYTEVEDAFFIFDEQRVVGYGAWSKAFIKIAKKNEWVLLSATPGDTWLDYIPVFIANGWYKHKTDFIDQHVVWTPRVKYPKVLRYQGLHKLVSQRNQVLVHMPYERHTKRHAVDIMCEYDEDLFEQAVKKRWHVFDKRPLRDVAELFIVMRRIVNSDSTRLQAVRQLSERHPKLIVFYNFDYELEALRTLVPADQLASPESIRELAEKVNQKRTDSSTTTSHMSTETRGSAQTSANTSSDRSSMPAKTSMDSSSITSSTSEDGNYLPSPASIRELAEKVDTQQRSAIFQVATDSSTTAHTQANCQGHWTTDRGMGEQKVDCGGKICKPSSDSKSKTGSGPGSKPSSKTQQKPNRTTTSANGSLDAATHSSAQMSESASGSFAVAEWNGHKHEEIPKTDSWVYLVQYRAGAEGWNCIETDAICFYSQTYSYRDWFQAHGRIDRLNTPFTDLYYYHLISKSVIDKAIRAALRVKKNFNERDLKL